MFTRQIQYMQNCQTVRGQLDDLLFDSLGQLGPDGASLKQSFQMEGSLFQPIANI